MTPERWQFLALDRFARRGARLRELAGDPTDLHDRQPCRIGEDGRHLQDDLELVPDRIGREVAEGLGAVARLEEECLARGRLGQSPLQSASLSRKDQRRHVREVLQHGLELAHVGPLRLLFGRKLSP